MAVGPGQGQELRALELEEQLARGRARKQNRPSVAVERLADLRGQVRRERVLAELLERADDRLRAEPRRRGVPERERRTADRYARAPGTSRAPRSGRARPAPPRSAASAPRAGRCGRPGRSAGCRAGTRRCSASGEPRRSGPRPNEKHAGGERPVKARSPPGRPRSQRPRSYRRTGTSDALGTSHAAWKYRTTETACPRGIGDRAATAQASRARGPTRWRPGRRR